MPAQRTIARYGWIPQLPDLRDARLQIDRVATLPAQVDLTSGGNLPPVYDQGQLGSCTANAIAAALDFENHRQTATFDTPSRLWIYYQERVIEGTVDQDSGAQIRDGIKVINKLGAPPEHDWPYDISTFAERPPAQAVIDARADEAVSYQSVTQDLYALKAVLAGGLPIVFGFTVYEAFESDEVARTGIVPMPSPRDEIVGGHAVALVGYDDRVDRFRARNSWGTGWGQHGYFEMPYLYVTSASLCSDFWVVQKTTAA
jgi:C1A family cysteine protease